MVRHIAATAAALTLAAAVGCQDDVGHKYGMKPMPQGSADSSLVSPSDPSVAVPPPPTVVPSGAVPLASGAYDQIQFKVPAEPGLIYIFDQDTQKVVTTNAFASGGGRTLSMADLGRVVQGLSTSDPYRIYFAPARPTNQPIGGGSGM